MPPKLRRLLFGNPLILMLLMVALLAISTRIYKCHQLSPDQLDQCLISEYRLFD